MVRNVSFPAQCEGMRPETLPETHEHPRCRVGRVPPREEKPESRRTLSDRVFDHEFQMWFIALSGMAEISDYWIRQESRPSPESRVLGKSRCVPGSWSPAYPLCAPPCVPLCRDRCFAFARSVCHDSAVTKCFCDHGASLCMTEPSFDHAGSGARHAPDSGVFDAKGFPLRHCCHCCRTAFFEQLKSCRREWLP